MIKHGTHKKYKVIYADPPWSYQDKALNTGGALRHYPTMKIEDIKALPINTIADTECILFMWATFPLLREALDVINAWGFQYKTCAFVWIKANKRTDTTLPNPPLDVFWGMGHWTRSNAEICLLAIKGKPKRIDAGVHQIIYAPIDKHSKKPDATRTKILRLCGDLPRVELFARQNADGWDVWGNEVENN